MVPDPLEDFDVFNHWKTEKIVPLLGDLRTREPNVYFSSPGYNDLASILSLRCTDMGVLTLISGEQAIFGFKHEEVVYPVVIWTIGYKDSDHGSYGTFGLILINGTIGGGLNESGVDIIQPLSKRDT